MATIPPIEIVAHMNKYFFLILLYKNVIIIDTKFISSHCFCDLKEI